MESIRFLLRYIVSFVVLLFSVIIVLWLMRILFPTVTLQSFFNVTKVSTSTEGWLPAPGSFKGLLGKSVIQNEYTNVYKAGEVFNGYANVPQGSSQVDYIFYTSTGTQVLHSKQETMFTRGQDPVSTKQLQKSLFIRNLSIYEGGHTYTGLSFTGEARETMFRDGKFPVLIVDQAGRVVSLSPAEATTNWSIPGWVRFQVKITNTLPVSVPCTMVFEEGNRYQNREPIRIAIPVICN